MEECQQLNQLFGLYFGSGTFQRISVDISIKKLIGIDFGTGIVLQESKSNRNRNISNDTQPYSYDKIKKWRNDFLRRQLYSILGEYECQKRRSIFVLSHSYAVYTDVTK